MKCEHGKKIKVIILYREDYKDDGFTSHIEGCTKCKLELEERFPDKQPMHICNMADVCTHHKGCIHVKEHPHTDRCDDPSYCDWNKDARCIEVGAR